MAIKTRRGAVINKETAVQRYKECDYLTVAESRPGIFTKTARVAGYGFIIVGVIVGVVAVISLLIGGLFLIPSVVSAFRGGYVRCVRNARRIE